MIVGSMLYVLISLCLLVLCYMFLYLYDRWFYVICSYISVCSVICSYISMIVGSKSSVLVSL